MSCICCLFSVLRYHGGEESSVSRPWNVYTRPSRVPVYSRVIGLILIFSIVSPHKQPLRARKTIEMQGSCVITLMRSVHKKYAAHAQNVTTPRLCALPK